MAVQPASPNIPAFDIPVVIKDPGMIEALKFARSKTPEYISEDIRQTSREHWFKLATQGDFISSGNCCG